ASTCLTAASAWDAESFIIGPTCAAKLSPVLTSVLTLTFDAPAFAFSLLYCWNGTFGTIEPSGPTPKGLLTSCGATARGAAVYGFTKTPFTFSSLSRWLMVPFAPCRYFTF